MGFNIEMFFDGLCEILDSDVKPIKKIRQLTQHIAEQRKYARECGYIK
jgi:hypothetical protein